MFTPEYVVEVILGVGWQHFDVEQEDFASLLDIVFAPVKVAKVTIFKLRWLSEALIKMWLAAFDEYPKLFELVLYEQGSGFKLADDTDFKVAVNDISKRHSSALLSRLHGCIWFAVPFAWTCMQWTILNNMSDVLKYLVITFHLNSLHALEFERETSIETR